MPRGVPYRSGRATIRKMLAYSVPPGYERRKPVLQKVLAAIFLTQYLMGSNKPVWSKNQATRE